MTLPRQEPRVKPRNDPPSATVDPAVPNLASLRVHEQTVLGWMLSPANHTEVVEHLLDIGVKHFLIPAHQEIYGSIMTHAGAPNIAVLVATSLVGETAPRSVRNLETGLFNYLSECREYADMLGPRELAYHVGQVRIAHLRRQRFEIHSRATKALEEDDLETYDALQAEMVALRDDAEPEARAPPSRSQPCHCERHTESTMTTEGIAMNQFTTAAVDRLAQVMPGVARLTDSDATIGTDADGRDVSLPLLDSGGARHTVVTGYSGTGKTELLRSLSAGAHQACTQFNLISPAEFPEGLDAEYFESLVRDQSGTQPMGLLLVDDLDGFVDETISDLAWVARSARKANLVLVVASQDIRMGSRGGAVLAHLTDATLVNFDGGAPGVGTVAGVPFRAWWAS